ncbi:ATP-dependent RNA helicase DHX8 [Merluccius polli]|uniref:ATP-dependent RNA helicase DHX8 n=1 Tax=Merluccius polli TaxID=89951 RepID=A0AA47MK46_MERPO|nr:ATP-dependent RNA helicase DHX8 [Merluccius polli]
MEQDDTLERKRLTKISDPEKWEIKQMIAANVLSKEEFPDFDDETGILPKVDDEEDEDLEIELVEEEPPFLRGHTKQSMDMSPVKIVKNPDGSLSQAAMMQSALAKERRELKQAAREAEMDSIPMGLNKHWVDPLPDVDGRQIAANMRGIGMMPNDIPEWKKHAFGGNKASYGKKTQLSILEQRESLPIYKLKEQLIQAVHDNQILIVIGETGSGKTTQITQYLAEAGYTTRGKIGCTQPRRVAAMSVAKRVSEEYGCCLGQEVGYTIRFEDCTSPETVIKYMTDGMLLRECLIDSELGQYAIIMLDEAHERTIHTDVLFGLLKKTVQKRTDMKLIVTSATLDAVKFSQYFYEAPIFTIPGRTYPVEVLYTKEPETDYLDASLITVMQIHLTEPPGDVLVFLTGQEEIDTACEILYERMKSLGPDVPELIILPVYSALPSEMQTRIFDPAPPGSRKVVIATNIAETSLTIDGIYYVVDPGFVKQKVYNSKTGIDQLVVTPISQAQAKQRAGRAGRTGPGKCYRLYTERAYRDEMLTTNVPEIQRTNLASTVLSLKAMGINDLLSFDFMDAPPMETLITAMEQLYTLGALDDEGLLTRLGRRMAEFPLEPMLCKMLIMSVHLGCSEEMLTIVSMLSVQNVFYRPKDKQALADQKKAKFHQPEGDHLTLLAVYNSWKNNKFSNPWCYENFIQARSLRRAQDIRKQMLGIMDRHKLDVVSCGKATVRVQKAICSGFFRNAAKKDPQEGYRTLIDQQVVYIHPSSALFNRQPEWYVIAFLYHITNLIHYLNDESIIKSVKDQSVNRLMVAALVLILFGIFRPHRVVYHELVLTTKEYMREVTTIDPRWLVEFSPAFFKVSDPTRLSKQKKQQRLEPLYNRYEEPNAWRISRALAGKHTTFDSFKAVLLKNGADFADTLIGTLLRLIQTMQAPPSTSNASQTAAKPKSEKEKLKEVFPALCKPDDPMWTVSFNLNLKFLQYVPPRQPEKDDEMVAAAAMKELEMLMPSASAGAGASAGASGSSKRKGNRWDMEPSEHSRRERDAGRGNGRHRSRSRSRSWSRERDSDASYKRRRKSRWSDRTPSPRREEEEDDRKDADDRDSNRWNDRHVDRPPPDEPVVGDIYNGKISSIMQFGCFVQLEGLRKRWEGLVHISELRKEGRIANMSDVVTKGQKVKVKVLSFTGTKASLSMKDVDQKTGEDLNPNRRRNLDLGPADEAMRNPDRPIDPNLLEVEENPMERKRLAKITDLEKWEIKQMIAANVLPKEEFPEFDEETGIMPNINDEEDEDLDVDLVEEEPPFLRGQTKWTMNLSPVKIVKNPDGSLSQAAMMQSALAKERREVKQQARAVEMDSIPTGLNKNWIDPMPDYEGRQIAANMRGIGAMPVDLPEWKRYAFGGNQVSYGKKTELSILEQRESLPIYKLKEQLVQAVHDNQILIVVGETGSGKTTQITQYLAEAGYTARGKIGCTQPRRVAAMSVAKRVSEEYGCCLGQEVGYTIRFEDCTSTETVIKYMTHGMLQRECLLDPDMSLYSLIMLDEAHERTIHTDTLFGLLKKTILKRKDMKLIVSSATLDCRQYFFEAPIFTIPGRTFPVEVLYTKEPETDYLDAGLITVMQIHLTEPPGDVLVFLTGQEEIDTACEILYERMKSLGPDVPELIILPVYSALPSEMQTRIFDPAPPGSRKVIIATNIAETSLTIDGIYYVVDPGFVKQIVYNSKTGIDQLVVTPISQAQAKQRSGRAGRTGPGKCYRLYTERAYRDEMLTSNVPEIQRTNLASTVLSLKVSP